MQTKAALCLQFLVEIPQRLLDRQGGMHGSAWPILVGNGRTKKRHHPIASILVYGSLEAVHRRRNQFEAAVEDLVDVFTVELFGEGGEAGGVGKQDGDLTALAFQG